MFRSNRLILRKIVTPLSIYRQCADVLFLPISRSNGNVVGKYVGLFSKRLQNTTGPGEYRPFWNEVEGNFPVILLRLLLLKWQAWQSARTLPLVRKLLAVLYVRLKPMGVVSSWCMNCWKIIIFLDNLLHTLIIQIV